MKKLSQLVLGTKNRKKEAELASLLATLGIEVQSLAAYPDAVDVVEDGDSFAANAALKATTLAKQLDHWVLGEDSGLAVDALNGAPGIFSARCSGPDATDASNNRWLLEQLGDRPLEQRSAHYVCHMTLSDPTGAIRAESEALCRGRIRVTPVGDHGFGYDPLFEIIEMHRTFGQLGPAVKAAISHRSRATALLLPKLRRLLATQHSSSAE